MSTAHVNLGVVGLRGWGKHVVRNFARTQYCNRTSIRKLNRDLRSTQHKLCLQAPVLDQHRTMLANPDLDAVVIATPSPIHFSMAKAA